MNETTATSELPGVGQKTTQAETAKRPDEGGDEPATAQARRGEVSDGEQQHGCGKSGIGEDWEPPDVDVGKRSLRGRRQCQRLQCGEHYDDRQQTAKLPERSDQAQ